MSPTDPKADTVKPAAALREAGTRARKGIEQAGRKGREVIAATKEKGDAVLSGALEKSEAVIAGAREKSEAVIAGAREKSEAVIDDTREKTMRAAAETNRLFQEHPIAAVAAAAAAGAVLGIFLPRLNVTSRFGKIATKAVKTAVATEAAQLLISGISDSGTSRKTPETDGNV